MSTPRPLFFLFLMAIAIPAFAQRQGNDLVVKITYDNGRAVAEQTLVEVTTLTGVTILDQMTRSQSEVRFQGVGPGTFRVRVSGPDIETKYTEPFNIDPRDNTHMEFVSVTKRAGAPPTSTQGAVASWQLNIPAKAESEFEKGVKALNGRDAKEAQKRLERATELYPQYVSALHLLGVIAMQGGDTQQGQQFFQQALKVDERYAPAYVNLAKIRIGEKKRDEAVELLTKAAAIEQPPSGETLALLSMVEFESNRLQPAIEHARMVHALKDHQKYAFVHFIAGKALEAQNLRDAAAAEYHLLLSEAPSSSMAARAKAALAVLQK